jgi:hypothetical protein
MRILEIEQLFAKEETLNKVLEACQEEFLRIDYFANSVLKSSISDNPEEVIKALNELTGIYMSLKPVVAIAETEKSNREIRQFNVLRIELENSGGKFTSASVEKQSSDFVANYRRIRNVVTAYLESAEKAISTLQSILKYLTTERNFKQE